MTDLERQVLESNERYTEACAVRNGLPYKRPQCLRCRDTKLVVVRRYFHAVDGDPNCLNEDDALLARCPDCRPLDMGEALQQSLKWMQEAGR